MTTTEVVLMALLVILVVLAGGFVLQVRAIARETRAMVKHVGDEGEETRAHLTKGLDALNEMQHDEVRALREFIEGRSGQAVATLREAEAVPKPHRHQWPHEPTSSERTNKMVREIRTCLVPGCRDVDIHEEAET